MNKTRIVPYDCLSPFGKMLKMLENTKGQSKARPNATYIYKVSEKRDPIHIL